jgi:circadian clock protein KaiC
LPEYSFNLLAGPPGAGKTTLMHQLIFANATAERPALYFTVVGEPPLKMLRYQQQMAFFDADKIGSGIRFVDLSPELLGGDLGRVFDRVVQHVKDTSPALVVVDSFRTVLRGKAAAGAELGLQEFLQRLALHLTSWHVTSFLLGEYSKEEMRDNPVFTVADGIIWLSQHRERNAMVRKLEVVKMRGVATMHGAHTFRISDQGLRVFPRAMSRLPERQSHGRDEFLAKRRAGFGVAGLDEMIGGGLPAGDATIIAGPSGCGKTVLSAHFVAEGLRTGEPAVLAVFEEHPEDYLERAKSMSLDLETGRRAGTLKVLDLKPLDLSAEEILHAIQEAVLEVSAKRLVIDSLNGLELALAPNFREDFREALYRMVGHLTGGGVSVLMTVEIMESFNEIKFSPHAISFLSQNIVFLRYVELESELRKMVTVIKMRRSKHSSQMREFDITEHGVSVLGAFDDYQGVLTGVPRARATLPSSALSGLTREQQRVLVALQHTEQASEDQLVTSTGLPAESVRAALGRLLALHHVLQVGGDATTVYRATERPLGEI